MTGLHDIAVAVLLGLSAALGVQALPPPSSGGWAVVRAWEPDGNGVVVQARSSAIVDACRAAPTAWIDFPRVTASAQRVVLDGRLVAQFGDPTFESARSFYGAPTVRCAEVVGGRELEWSAWSSTRYFARVPFLPRVTHRPQVDRFFEEILPLMAAGSLFPGGLFCLVVFRRTAPLAVRSSLLAACVGFGTYCLVAVIGRAGIGMSMLSALRLADMGLLLGTAAFANALRVEGMVPGVLFWPFVTAAVVGMAVLAIAPTGDVVLLGGGIPLPFTALVLAAALAAAVRRARAQGPRLGPALEVASLGLFAALFAHDVLLSVGLLPGVPLGPIALLGGVIFFVLAVHGRVVDAFRERDFLRAHLEAEVERHTIEARRRARELSDSLDDLRRTQAQLVHSEKMASLGVLVAGVAHELNNPISFIASNVSPLQQLVSETHAAAERGARDAVSAGLERIARIVDVMHRGAERTMGIVADLRSFSRRGTGEDVVVDLHDGIEVTLRLLRARWAGRIEVVRDYGPPLHVLAPCGELNQVLMNLLANACDAIPTTGHLWIRTRVGPEHVTIAVRDDGIGIAPADLPRIFDPFFTTKGPGKGTGLGLAVSHGIVARLGGAITVDTAPGAGTTMTIALPATLLAQRERRANAR